MHGLKKQHFSIMKISIDWWQRRSRSFPRGDGCMLISGPPTCCSNWTVQSSLPSMQVDKCDFCKWMVSRHVGTDIKVKIQRHVVLEFIIIIIFFFSFLLFYFLFFSFLFLFLGGAAGEFVGKDSCFLFQSTTLTKNKKKINNNNNSVDVQKVIILSYGRSSEHVVHFTNKGLKRKIKKIIINGLNGYLFKWRTIQSLTARGLPWRCTACN